MSENTVVKTSVAQDERLRYERVWWEPGYRVHSPGVRAIQQFGLLDFFAANGVKSILDAGCGTGKASKMFQDDGRFVVRGIDIAANALEPDVNIPFTRGCLWSPLDVGKEVDAVFCCDVMEHVPTDYVSKTLRVLRAVTTKLAFFGVCTVPDVWGKRVLKAPLHLTVKKKEWWMAQFVAAGFALHPDTARFISSETFTFAALVPVEPVKVNEHPGCPVAVDAKCILVGNGPSVLGRKLGSTVDGFDEVLRFNAYSLKGYEDDVGTKTTMWVTFGRGTMPTTSEPPPRVLFIHGTNGLPAVKSDVWRIPLAFWGRLRSKLQALSKRSPEGVVKITPSSGCLTAGWLAENGVKQVTLLGFDHFSKEKTGMHHYWVARSFGRPVEHDGDAEALLMGELKTQGRVVYL